MATSSTDKNSDGPIESPCVRLCTLDENDVCLGCWRNVDEICAWGGAGDDERRRILAAAELRRQARAAGD